MDCKKEEMNVPPQPPLPEKDEAGVIDVNFRVPTDILAIQKNEHIQDIFLTGGPVNTKIYWSWYDPDDPATNPDIDPNSWGGEDDSISIEFLDVYEENGNYYTITDEQGNTSLRYKIIWKDIWKTFPGDNFQIIGVAGSPNGTDSSITKEIFTIRRMWIEYDYFDIHPDLGWDPNILTHYPLLDWDLPEKFFSSDPNRNSYILLEKFVNINESLEPPEYTPIIYELPELAAWATLLRDSSVEKGASRNYIHLIGATRAIDAQGNTLDSIFGRTIPRDTAYDDNGIQFGTPGFSFVFTVTFIYIKNYPPDHLLSTTLHELGHQVGALLHPDGQPHDDECVMHHYEPGNPRNDDPVFCGKCVRRLRNDVGRL